MKKKILIISEIFYPEIGSGANRISNIVKYLKRYDYDITVLTSNPKYPLKELYTNKKFWDDEKEKEILDGVNLIRINPSKAKVTNNFFIRAYIYVFFMLKSMIKILRLKKDYDVVVATIPSIFIGVLGVFSKKKFKSKFILDIRDLWPECIKNISIFKKSKIVRKFTYSLESYILKRADSLIINSDGFRSYLRNKGYKNKIEFVPNSLSDIDIVNNKKIISTVTKHKDFTIIYSGLLGMAQNASIIVETANYLRNYNNIKFKIIGEGVEKNKVIKLMEEYELNNISINSAMPKDEVIKEVAKCHIGLVHLRGDSAFDLVIPGKIIDYMGVGIPIVAGVEGYTASVIEKSGSGITVPCDDYIKLGQAILKIYNNTFLQESYSKNGLEYSSKYFTWDLNIKKVDELIGKVIRGEKN